LGLKDSLGIETGPALDPTSAARMPDGEARSLGACRGVPQAPWSRRALERLVAPREFD